MSMISSSLPLNSVKLELLSTIDPALASTLFTPSASTGLLELTSTGRVVFAFAELAANVMVVDVNPAISLHLRAFETVPEKGTFIAPNSTQVLVVDPSSSSFSHRSSSDSDRSAPRRLVSSSLRDHFCPWLSDIAAAEIEGHLRLCRLSGASRGNDDDGDHSARHSCWLPRGLLITGEQGAGTKTLAVSLARSIINTATSSSATTKDDIVCLDCSELAQFCVVHSSQQDFNPQTAIRNVLRLWTVNRPLVLLNVDVLDGGQGMAAASTSNTIASSSSIGFCCSLSERTRRILLLELVAAFRKKSVECSSGNSNWEGYLMWIGTAASNSILSSSTASGSSSTALSRWIATTVSLGVPEYSQRKALFANERVFGLLLDHRLPEEKRVATMNNLLVRTHGWSLSRLFCKAELAKAISASQTQEQGQEEPGRQQQQQREDAVWQPPARIFGMDQDLRLLVDACVAPLCRVASEIRSGLVNLSPSPSSSQQQQRVSTAGASILPKGILCVGAVGCGKTLLLKHLAHQLAAGSSGGVSVILQDTLSLVQKEVGATEMAIHQLFERARAAAPCVLLLDHIDSVAAPRSRSASSGADSSAQVADRMLSTLLVEMDGVGSKTQRDKFVIVVATAPSLECLDSAIRRPGRLDIHVHVKPPTVETAIELILHKLRRTLPRKPDGQRDLEHENADAMMVARRFLLAEKCCDAIVRPLLASYADVESFCVKKLTSLVSQKVLSKSDDDVGFASGEAELAFATFDDWCQWITAA